MRSGMLHIAGVVRVPLIRERDFALDADAVIANQRLIWEGLKEQPSTGALTPTGDPLVDGWLALAPLVNAPQSELRRELLTWRQTYTSHPAAGGLLAELLAAQRSTAFPQHIALLLPLSSPQRAAALAVRDGFLAARGTSVCSNEDDVHILATARFKLHGHAQGRCEAALPLLAAGDIEHCGYGLREVLQRRRIAAPIEKFAAVCRKLRLKRIPQL